MIVLFILAIWTASLVPIFFIGVGVGRDDERARVLEDAQRRDRLFSDRRPLR